MAMSKECVERTREVLSAAAELLGDGALAPLPGRAGLEASDNALESARRALAGVLEAHAEELPATRVAALMLDSVEAQVTVKGALLERRAEVAAGAREALSALRNAPSASALAERAPIEARRIGFRRALFSKIEQGTWLARSGFSVSDPDFGQALVEVGRAHPRRLMGPLLESEMVRRCTPMVICDPQSPGPRRVHQVHRNGELCRRPGARVG
jgi:hypothetical protein